MVTVEEVLKLLPPFNNQKKMVVYRQTTNEIIDEIINKHFQYETDYDSIYKLFDTGDIYTTAKGLWEFCKYRLKYSVEPENSQSVKSPSAILQPGHTVDCKHYSLFIGGVLGAIKDNENDGWDWCYRFASYNNDKHVEHVFCVVFDGSTEIWIDPVLRSFNDKKKPVFYIDEYIMPLYSISGIGAASDDSITVSKDMAESNFLILVNLNVAGLKDFFMNNMNVVNGPVRNYFLAKGFDFQNLLNFLV